MLKPRGIATSSLPSLPARSDTTAPTLRPGQPEDIDALLVIEERAFETDRISRRSFRRFLASPTAALIVAEVGGAIAGYALLLFRRSTALSRLYSIAVDEAFRGRGLGQVLLDAAEAESYERGAIVMRLEVREDNASAIRLYTERGYRQFGTHPDYYEDHATALRFEKLLGPPGRPPTPAIPFYEQQTDFTCGPACIMMAMAWRDATVRLDLALELNLWREATTIFMTSGHGGCDPFGLAVSLRRRGFLPEVHVSHDGPYFLDGVRHAEKRRMMAETRMDLPGRIRGAVGPRAYPGARPRGLLAALDDGALVMILVSGYRMFSKKVPALAARHRP